MANAEVTLAWRVGICTFRRSMRWWSAAAWRRFGARDDSSLFCVGPHHHDRSGRVRVRGWRCSTPFWLIRIRQRSRKHWGRKVHRLGFRLGIIKTWQSRWFAEGEDYAHLLGEDLAIRELIRKQVGHAGIDRVEIERLPNQVIVIIHTAKPGIIIGRRGAAVKELREDLETLTGKKIKIDVHEVDKPDLSARLVAENIASQLERRISHGRAIRRAVQQSMRSGAEGVMIACGRRMPGSEMARL